MRRWTVPVAVVAVAVVAVGAVAVVHPGVVEGSGEEGRDRVVVRDEDGRRLAVVSVRVADDPVERYRGLSGTTSLADGKGMLFVHPEAGEYAYVMRGMNYPLDIVFVAGDGRITRIHHARLPPEGTPARELTEYRGRGRYVLEVPLGYTNRTGIDAGDRVVVPERYR